MIFFKVAAIVYIQTEIQIHELCRVDNSNSEFSDKAQSLAVHVIEW